MSQASKQQEVEEYSEEDEEQTQEVSSGEQPKSSVEEPEKSQPSAVIDFGCGTDSKDSKYNPETELTWEEYKACAPEGKVAVRFYASTSKSKKKKRKYSSNCRNTNFGATLNCCNNYQGVDEDSTEESEEKPSRKSDKHSKKRKRQESDSEEEKPKKKKHKSSVPTKADLEGQIKQLNADLEKAKHDAKVALMVLNRYRKDNK